MKQRIFLSLAAGLILCSILSAGCSKDDIEKMVYTVAFDADGGTPVPASQRVEEGGVATAPATNPTKKGYVFLFWQLEGATTAYDFQTAVKSNITLTAKWQAESTVEYWQVTWELDGGAWPAGDNHATQVVKGGTLAEPAEPTKAACTFDGWYKEAALTNKVAFPYNVSGVTGNITLYAKWKAEGSNPSSYNYNIGSTEEWNTAVAAVNAGGNNKTYTFTILKSFSLTGIGANSIFTKELTGLTVTVKGQGSPVPEISLSTVGYLIYLASSGQKIILENIVLNGRTNNNAAVLGVKAGELTIGLGTVITGNTNRAGGAGGVDVGGKLILAGGKITGNTSGTAAETNGHGGGVFLDTSAEFVMESGSISGNRVYGQGGGVYMSFYARFKMKDGLIFANTAWAASSGARGGGVYNSGGDLNMGGGKITGYDWAHGNDIDLTEHYTHDLDQRDNCNSVTIGVTVMGNFGAALYSPSGDNYFGTFDGESFTKTGDIGYNIHIERDIEIADGIRLNRFEVNGVSFHTYFGGMDYWGNYYNATTENIFLGITTIYGEWIALDMLVPKGNDRLVPGTYTFSTAVWASLAAYTFTDNDYTSFVQDADGIKLKMTGGTVKVSITGTGETAVYTIAMDCTLENGGLVKGTYRGTLKWYDLSK